MNELAVAYHEAGHYVAANRLGLPIAGRTVLTIIPGEDYLGLFVHRSILSNLDEDTSDRSRLKMERTVQVMLAGIEAQRHFDPASVRYGETYGDWDGGSDYHEAIGLLYKFTSGTNETEAYLELLRIRAENLVRGYMNWRYIQAVAVALCRERTLSASGAKRIMQDTTLATIATRRTDSTRASDLIY